MISSCSRTYASSKVTFILFNRPRFICSISSLTFRRTHPDAEKAPATSNVVMRSPLPPSARRILRLRNSTSSATASSKGAAPVSLRDVSNFQQLRWSFIPTDSVFPRAENAVILVERQAREPQGQVPPFFLVWRHSRLQHIQPMRHDVAFDKPFQREIFILIALDLVLLGPELAIYLLQNPVVNCARARCATCKSWLTRAEQFA